MDQNCHIDEIKTQIIDFYLKNWSVREDLNLRPLPPEGSALPGCATHRGAQNTKRQN